MFHTTWRFLLLTLLFVALMAASRTSATAQENLILVIDSSGSMAGQIEGKIKLDIARSAIGDLLSKLKPSTKLGLMAYGHRRKGDCSDIETIYQVGNPDAKAVIDAVKPLQAIGKTPLTAAVRQAAEQLKYTEEKATVILISDGKETCDADPCAIGRELKKKGIDFTVHVIGFDIKKDESAGLQCLAEATGGLYVSAGNAKDLDKAIYKTVVEAQAAEPKQPKPQPVAGEGLRVDVVVKEGGAAWKGDLGLKIFGEKSGLEGKRKEIANSWRAKSGHVFKKLPAGKYLLEVVLADHKHIKRTFDIEVKPDQAQIVTANMNIGQVRIDASLKKEGEPFKGDLGWTFYETKKDLAGKRKQIANFWRAKSGNVFWLPEGTWYVTGVIADAKYLTVARELSVEAGGGETHAFSFNAGTVRFDASLAEEGPEYKGDLGWTVLSTEKDLSGKRKKITNFWRAKTGNIFLLPAGKWLIDGVLADHKHVTTNKTIEVAPGSEVAHSFNFKAGKIRFDVTADGKATKDDLGLTILGLEKDLAGNRKKIANFWRVKSGHITLLPAGKYLVQGLLADHKKTTGETTIEVAPGDEKAVPVALKSQ